MGAPDHQTKVSHCIRSDVIRPVGQRCTRARRPAWIASSTVHFVGKGRDKAQKNDCAAGDDISGGTAVFSSATPRFQSVQKACSHKEVYFDAAE